ncbi:hypothetical protein N7481_006584 [Penicillium waksmanii]|uniref:uncharacterized protein n=1 Tax=Penicillium waksmanii TaxID=69791 RepID=UPI0025497901|nr:uncharacterized protein N7481_006584 [Penicillium waksmanii]KAJ5984485.1 hypothetical protein N7481_006584 [Penicillium waksmanii]
MSWHSHNMNLSSTQGQNQEPLKAATSTMASNTDNISEYAEPDPLFEDLEHFTADHLLDFLFRYGPSDTTSPNPGNAPSTLNWQTAVGENNPDNSQPYNGGSNRPNNDSKSTTSESSLLCPWPACEHRKPFSNKATLKRHYNTLHVAPGSFECDKCSSVFNRKDNLNQHLQSVHEEKKS